MLDDISILLVFVIGAVGLDDLVDAVDGARNAVRRDEVAQIPVQVLICILHVWKLISTHLSKKSTDTPKSCAMLFKPTTRYDWSSC